MDLYTTMTIVKESDGFCRILYEDFVFKLNAESSRYYGSAGKASPSYLQFSCSFLYSRNNLADFQKYKLVYIKVGWETLLLARSYYRINC